MKIECDKCAAKYSIADEKVRGKTFKIRCKKCSNVIIVRDKAGGGGLAAEAEAPAAVGWHLAINGETIGPMSEDDVRQRFASGEVDRDTAVWQEGFEDWLPLGDVETFADLVAGGASAEDPFTSANQDEYAAASAPQARAASAAVAAAPVARAAASGGSAAVAEPSSPRVTRLTGQRNENSVLFSLDSLQSLATGGGGAANNRSAQQQRSGPRGLATQAPSSEGSGLIDIRALGAMVGSDAGPTPVAAAPKPEDASLPSFGGASLGGLASAPLVPQTHAVDAAMPMMVGAAAQPQRSSNAPLYIIIALLVIGMGGLGAYIVFKPQDTVVVERSSGADAPTAKDDDEDKDKDKEKDKEKDDEGEKAKDDEGEKAKDEDGKEEGGAEEAAAEGGEAAAEGGDEKGEPGKPKTSGTKPSGSKTTPSKPSGSPVSTPAKPTPTPAKPTPSSDNLDVDCILDPKLPKCKGGGSKPSTGGTKPTPAPTDPSLPETLGTAEIKAGVGPVKDQAKACGSKHGAQPGESVKVKLSIAGATGLVTSASAEAPHAGTPLGNCVAAALKKATFKKFRKASLGAVYPVKM